MSDDRGHVRHYCFRLPRLHVPVVVVRPCPNSASIPLATPPDSPSSGVPRSRPPSPTDTLLR